MKKKSKKKSNWKHYAGWTAFGLATLAVAREVYLTLGPNREDRRTLFMAAFNRAQATKKPLVVIGDPDGGLIHHFLGRDFQCGDICIDPKGCGICPVTQISGDPTTALSSMKANSAVIFDSGLFAFSDDGYAMAEQMKRVSGGDLFMWDVSPWTLTAFLESKRKRRVMSAPPASQTLAWKTGLLTKEPRTGQHSGSVALQGLGVRYLGNAAGPNAYYYEQLVQRYAAPPPQFIG